MKNTNTLKEKELKRYKKEIERIYRETSKAFRQRAGMRRKLGFYADKIVELENELNK
jgi:hypothetical protein